MPAHRHILAAALALRAVYIRLRAAVQSPKTDPGLPKVVRHIISLGHLSTARVPLSFWTSAEQLQGASNFRELLLFEVRMCLFAGL